MCNVRGTYCILVLRLQKEEDTDSEFRYNSFVHCEILQTLLTSSSCPEPVLKLCAAAILRLFPIARQIKTPLGIFDSSQVREKALLALGLPSQGELLQIQHVIVDDAQ